ncbi:FKBP-type peptidyl-prolyl cis-trans isomerase [Paenarthrobacter nicotinovorans]|uniref:FKBP-type peptidyl-prolyl cis-trans isomerase n=1 Tax=Paenarthrobacter nicotinovorans TaxID=29320 RepID=A0ABT9TL18_PAENI|nr:hypothetical protein [Paenarthrobacter nicotinovorans]MDQ0102348.1 FKBP-type peptidyl-prolyl cis-trans isomerase [Paenarthrobacter nicotinovorans]
MANIELKHETTGRKVTVNDAVAEFYTSRGWAESDKQTPATDEAEAAAQQAADDAAKAAAEAEGKAAEDEKEKADAADKAGSDNADSDTGEGTTAARKTTKRVASS